MEQYFFMLQQYEGQGAWTDTATRYVQLKPRRSSGELDPVAAWAVRHMNSRKGGPFRVKVREYLSREFRQTFAVHSDGTRTVIQDAAATAATSQAMLDFRKEL
ncbi:hypothetical protein OIU91_04565 [Streptomyces sp. NBC_01456]|uniref:hypothetical protein n=1 Tax=unclassified Streptomyces TaxID=2593676 RepID=UPI002E327D7D|nr:MULTISPECIES: hypothetical protein [unclassified Streptomyces]